MNLKWFAVILLEVVLFASPPISAAGPHKHHSTAATATDPSYVFALATANRFLHAWQTGDLETGTVLLSDSARHSRDPEKFEQFFAGTADRAFEIARGKANRGRYRFDVVLVTSAGSGIRRRFSEIIVVNAGKNDWLVDKLP